MVEKALLYVQNIQILVYPNTLLNLFLNEKLVTILDMKINLLFNCRTESFENSFSPHTVEAWYSLESTTTNFKSLEVFKRILLAFIQPAQRSIYSVFNLQRLKYLTRLRLGMSHLNNTDLDIL